MKRHKYNATRTVVDGYKLDSKAEAKRYVELSLLQRAGKINGLAVHPRYEIVINGAKICTVILDFEYTEKGRKVTEDVKGARTALSNLKRKLVEAVHGITVVLIEV